MKIGEMYTIDFTRVSKIPKFSVAVKNGDSKRTISLILLENNIAINLNNYTVTVAAKKSDGNDIFNNVKIVDAKNGICEVEVTKQMSILDTDLPCEIILYGADGTIASSSNFVISKISSVRNEESIVSSSEFTALSKAMLEVKSIDHRFKEVDSQINTIMINVKNYGAVGDGVTDDTESIKLAYMDATKINGTLHFPFGTYRTTQTLIFNANVNLKMEGFIQQDFGLNIPIIVFGGDSGVVIKGLKGNLKARRNPNENYSYANWDDENNIAIVVKNIQNSNIQIDEASYCCVGVKLMGDNAGLSYSSIRFNNIANNKISVLFGCIGNKEDGAFVTELSLYGGRLTKNSTLNATQNNYGVVSRITKEQNMIDNIKWYDLCLELQKYSTSENNENICFDLQYCKDFKVINYRAEKIRSEYLAYLAKCEGVEFIPGGVYDAPKNIKFVELSTWDSKTKLTNRIKGYDKEQELININVSKNMFYERKSYNSDNIKRKVILNHPLVSVNFNYVSSFKTPLNYTYETIDIEREILTNKGLRLLANNSNDTNVGVRVITAGHKYFKIETNSCLPIAVLCYDVNGNYLTPTETNKYAYFYYSEIRDYNGNKVLITKDTTQDDAKYYPQKEVEIVITDDTVGSFVVLVCGNNKNTPYDYVSTIKVKALYINGEIDKLSNPSVECDFKCKPFPSQATKPVGLGYWGEIIYNSQPSYGLDIGWVCTKTGDDNSPSTWRSIGTVGDN